MQKNLDRILNVILVVCCICLVGIITYCFIPKSKYINGTLSVYDYAEASFTDSKGNDTDFLKLIVGKEYTFNLEIDSGYVCEFVLVNGVDIAVPYTFTAPEVCNIEFAIIVDANNELTIQPSPPVLVGWNIQVTAYGSDCSVQVDCLDCLEHSPCLVEDCINTRVLSSNTVSLENNIQQQIFLASGTVDN